MKLSVIGLFVLGLVAALSAAVLVASLRTSSSPLQPAAAAVEEDPHRTVQVLVAARDLAPNEVLGADSVRVREVLERVAPEDCYSDPVQVIGRVLTVPVHEEQALLHAQFASEGSSHQLVAALEKGKRAVNVLLSDPMGMERLLYPGAIVDVLASIKVKGDNQQDEETLSVTMLQGIQVLAVGEKTIVHPEAENASGEFVIQQERRPTVTLLVDPQQAEILKLAMHNGSVSLTMRNPMDDSVTPHEGTRLAELSPILKAREAEAENRRLAAELAKAREEARKATLLAYEMEKAAFDNERDREEIEIDREKLEHEKWKVSEARAEETENVWETVVIRGGVAETRTFRRPASGIED